MALVHNLLIRGLNSIILQAPHIAPSSPDVPPFLTYIQTWLSLIHAHHRGEEADFFPAVEAMAGEKGMMDGNVEQHHAFEKPLERFGEYVDRCQKGEERWDGDQARALVEDFGSILVGHLADEIPSIQGLRRFGDKLENLQKVFDEEGQKGMKQIGLKGLTIIFSMLDLHYENDTWINWPPAPKVINFITRGIVWWFVRDVTKFGACDRLGNMKALYAVPVEDQKPI